jgi:hypothetical protein
MRQPTLKSVCQYLGGGAFGRHGCVEDTVLAVVAALLVVNGHAPNGSGMHGFPAPAALHASRPLD